MKRKFSCSAGNTSHYGENTAIGKHSSFRAKYGSAAHTVLTGHPPTRQPKKTR